MKELLSLFNYIQKFVVDNLYACEILFECILLKQNNELFNEILDSKDKEILESFYLYINSLGIESRRLPEGLNWKKILKSLAKNDISIKEIESFVESLALKKTILKLHNYATPLEISKIANGILDIKRYDVIYNPTCGFGTWLLSLGDKDAKVYANDINPTLINIARMLSYFVGIKVNFSVSDIFLDSSNNKEYDKIFCHPPILKSLNLPHNDKNLTIFGKHIKTMPELPFLAHCLKHLKTKAVFIVRDVTLINKKFITYLTKNHLLECVISLPKNIFPANNAEFSLIVLSKDNKKVFFINAQNYFIKEGKYNKIIREHDILDLYLSKQDKEDSILVDYNSLKSDLSVSAYLKRTNNVDCIKLKECLTMCFRGQRFEDRNGKNLISCYELGVNSFAEYGFTEELREHTLKDSVILKYALREYDICLSMRGVSPKITIIGSSDKPIVANTGILVLRAKSSEIAICLYLYFLSSAGYSELCELYAKNNGRITDKIILNLEIPKDVLNGDLNKFQMICEEYKKIKIHKNNILEILN